MYKDELDYTHSKLCETCGKIFYKKKCDSMNNWNTKKFCSLSCRRSPYKKRDKSPLADMKDVHYFVLCKHCGIPFKVKSLYYLEKRKYCSHSCQMKDKNPSHTTWTKSRKIIKSNSQKKKVKDGSWKNPVHMPGVLDKILETKRTHPIVYSKERLDLASKLAAERIITGKNPNLGNYKYGKIGKFMSAKNGTSLKFRSSFEKRAFEILEQDSTVLAYYPEHLYIPYIDNGIKRRYIPDILVDYADGTKKLIEVKPLNMVNTTEVVLKKEAAIPYCKEHGIAAYEIWTEPLLFPNRNKY